MCYIILYGLNFFYVGFILSENVWHIRYVFDISNGVINIFDGDGVQKFLFIQMI